MHAHTTHNNKYPSRQASTQQAAAVLQLLLPGKQPHRQGTTHTQREREVSTIHESDPLIKEREDFIVGGTCCLLLACLHNLMPPAIVRKIVLFLLLVYTWYRVATTPPSQVNAEAWGVPGCLLQAQDGRKKRRGLRCTPYPVACCRHNRMEKKTDRKKERSSESDTHAVDGIIYHQNAAVSES